MNKKNINKYIAIVLFLALIILPVLSWGVINIVSINNPKILKELDFDLGEKRYKATLSETLDATNITSELEKVYNDRIPFRSVLISFKTSFDAMIEAPYKNIEKKLFSLISAIRKRNAKYQAEEIDGVIKLYMDDAVDVYYNHGLMPKEIDPYDPYIKYPIKYSTNEKVIIGQSDWLFLNSNNIGLYTGTESIDLGGMKEYVEICEKFRDICKKYGKELVILICPEKEEIYKEYMPYMEIVDEKERALKIREYIATASDVTYIYPKEELIEAKKKYMVYRKYDSHWNYIGGYIGAKKILDSLGIETKPIRNYGVAKVGMIDCELVAFGGFDISTLAPTFEYQVFYKDNINYEQIEVAGTKEKIGFKAISNCDNEQKLFIMGDSFSHALLQYLFKEFKECYYNNFTDLLFNRIEIEEIKNELKNADIVLLELVERNEAELIPELTEKLTEMFGEIYDSNE